MGYWYTQQLDEFQMSYVEPKKAEHILYYSMKSRTDRTNMGMKNQNGDCLLVWEIFRYICISQ